MADLEAVLEHLELERAALVGSSMGAATAMAFTLEHPERVPALVQITPAYTGYARTGDVDGERLGSARRGARQGRRRVRRGGRSRSDIPDRWRAVAREATRQRMERHEHLDAVAQALREVPRSVAWKGLEPLVVARGPGADRRLPGRRRLASTPSASPRSTAASCPNAELVVEDKGQVPAGLAGSPPVRT